MTMDITNITINISDSCLDEVELESERGTDAYDAEASEIMDRYCAALRSIWRGWYPHATVQVDWSCNLCPAPVEVEYDGTNDVLGYGASTEICDLVAEATDRAWCAVWQSPSRRV